MHEKTPGAVKTVPEFSVRSYSFSFFSMQTSPAVFLTAGD
ncbi:hypothetical protein BRYFOR_05719 [Marvinbryantia formatexigens DSM 14469]|uniref:Uncharacterized protein n=1 Tax=Marvinbryantia formatexigens DSM 14469 TaxID=478749 RepID=C6LAS5_9FIRM|nr:hypothetical protein BRYFOR_05719 [Marvinbryantia formatexigens DSM 14469]